MGPGSPLRSGRDDKQNFTGRLRLLPTKADIASVHFSAFLASDTVR